MEADTGKDQAPSVSLKAACERRTSTPDFLIVSESGGIERYLPASKNQGTVEHERS